jgi:hypothetical protein
VQQLVFDTLGDGNSVVRWLRVETELSAGWQLNRHLIGRLGVDIGERNCGSRGGDGVISVVEMDRDALHVEVGQEELDKKYPARNVDRVQIRDVGDGIGAGSREDRNEL